MVSSLQRTPPRLSVREFRAFYAQRPDHERWELIDGVAVMMAPPTVVHQRIASNLQRLLLAALDHHNPALTVYQRAGVNIDPDGDYDPEPDVVVVDAAIVDLNERYSDRFYLAAEIVSRSDAAWVDRKREGYKRTDVCKCILTIQQDSWQVRIDLRTAHGWQNYTLRDPGDEIMLPDFGLRCSLADIYKGVPLKPLAS